MLCVQIASDIHLESNLSLKFDDVVVPHPQARVLCLAGDIGDPLSSQYKTFINRCADTFEHVVIVPGNHEYLLSASSMDETDRYIQHICPANVYYLPKGSSVEPIGGYNFIGGTLWTHIPVETEYMLQKVTKAGFQSIRDYNDEHARQLANIKCNIDDKKCNIVITHHAPILSNQEMYTCNDAPDVYLYGSSALTTIPNVSAWFYGHTHKNYSGVYGEDTQDTTIIATNQHGRKAIPGWSKTSIYWMFETSGTSGMFG